MKQTIFTETYKVRSTQLNVNNQLGLYGVLGILQDIAAEHAENLGFGYEQLVKEGFFWVLTQQKLKMKRWPKWNERITVKTWSLPVMGVYAFREFEILSEKGEVIGSCSSTWITLDIASRKPIDLSDRQELFYARTDGALDFKTERIDLPSDLELIKKFNVRISDLDVNLHVNNIKYSQWVLDMLSLKNHKNYAIKEYDINFLSETFYNDEIQGYSSTPTFETDGNITVFFCGKKSEQTKPAFIAKLVAEPIKKNL
ncbi:acyl-[acyl-carrier-protein] thioesterase [Capnocytophaga canimorsus]|uniref:acyl-[acyl-carrier-protein] thioesterase n=1 Tax=Capnocytophaga canimorsus TaxID=28188 RepID=UPI001562DB9E|nr:acyl-ACP thioesterase domain-containing protein [Capnocytophaga canimorsus]